ncbi:hypothetical protein [Pontibacter beigongshangensis]|uniref:hypothetical protein n=1 Tax=Pontibacter beigongshangensis TaxID=2574733 RepID=UPI00164F657D|nr:hypothetical protein [Pontibacter beigongshangensis]
MDIKRKIVLQKQLWCTALIVIFLSPATLFAQRSFYTPKSLIMPLHDQQNQLHVSVGRAGGYDLHLSYAFTNKFAVFGTATLDHGIKKRRGMLNNRSNIDRNDYVLRGGLGYFRKKEGRMFPILEVYAGAGVTKIDNYWYSLSSKFSNEEVTKAGYWSYFGQINFGDKLERVEYGVGLRLVYSNYNYFRFYNRHRSNDFEQRQYIGLRGLTAEPGMNITFNLPKRLQVTCQYGLAIPLGTRPVKQTNTTAYFDGSSITVQEQVERTSVPLMALMGRLGLQYTLYFSQKE